jgi:DNA-binding CsgD family transcriptional regulator/tetratricopeptide (TPR) repeat protein
VRTLPSVERCSSTPAASASGDAPLLERDDELDSLRRLLEAGLAGEPVLILIEGPAGIGKSRLLTHVRERATAGGCRVLSARGSDLEREFSFGIVRQLFEPLLVDHEQRDRLLEGSAAPAGRVFAAPGDSMSVADVSFGILHGLFWLTANAAADRPLLLAIDDVHWCDPASMRFLAYLERRIEGIPAVVAVAVRTGEPSAEPLLLDEIAQGSAVVSVRPRAFSAVASAELVRRRLGHRAEEPFWRACHVATGGNPLLLSELLRTLQAERVPPDAAHVDMVRDIGPRAVSRSVLLRLARLAGEAVAVARGVAILGDDASPRLVAALTGLDEPTVVDAADVLARVEILRAGSPLGFVHPLVRDAVYNDLRPSERERNHARAAALLIDRGASPELVAAHLLLAPGQDQPGIAEVFRAAGLAASGRGDADAAVSYLRRALESSEDSGRRPQLLFDLGMAEAGIDASAAARHMSEAYDGLEDPVARAFAARVLARMLLFTGTADEAVAVARRAAGELPVELGSPRRAFEAFELYCVAFGADVPDASARLAKARAHGVGHDVGAKILGAVAAWDWALTGGSSEDCAALALEVLADGELIAADPGFGSVIAGGVLGLADREEAPAVWDAAMSEAERLGALRTVCLVNIFRGFTWLQRGDLPAADATLCDAFEQIRTLETNGVGMAYVAALLARFRIEQGDLAGAHQALAHAGGGRPPCDGDALLRRSAIELMLAQGRWTDALEAVEAYRRRLRSDLNPAWAPWRSLAAVALDGLGQRGRALVLLEEELDLARRWGAPGPLGRALRLQGSMNGDDGIALLHQAVEVTEGSPAHLEHARALVALGSVMRRAGRRTDARVPLRRGLDAATRCGATEVSRQARDELLVAGARPHRVSLTGPGALTPSERRVADLAADGLRNGDIAHTLSVSRKTVEIHLTSVYRKLGISTRAALAGALTGVEEAGHAVDTIQ